MSLKSELLQFLARMPNIQTVSQRKALLANTGFDRLDTQIIYEGNNHVFVNGLIERLCSEGQKNLVSFLKNIVQSDWVGLEDRDRLTILADNIRALTMEQWEREFRGFGQNTQVKTSMSRMELIQTLGKLSSSDFNTLVFALGVPNSAIPSSGIEQGNRAFALLQWADSLTGCGLSEVEENLKSLLPQ